MISSLQDCNHWSYICMIHQKDGTLAGRISRVWEVTEECAVSFPLYSSCEDQSMMAACILYWTVSISLMDSPYML